MAAQDYSLPVAQLLALGDPRGEREWRDYLKLGFKSEHVPDLIRMALDEDLHTAVSESKEVWSPIHAWRTLGQLRAQDAIEPLLALFQRIDEDGDDWVGEELHEVYGMIGVAAIPALVRYLSDASHGLWARVGASNGLEDIAEHFPNSHSECIGAITAQLEQFSKNEPTLNGCLIADLLDLNAVESAPVMERAFAAQRVDISVAGDWEDIQIEFGMKKERTAPRERTELDDIRDKFVSMVDAIVSNKPKPIASRSDLANDVISQMLASGELKLQPKPQLPKSKKKK